MTRLAIAIAIVCATAGGARAEEGLFVTRLGGGVASVHPDMPSVGSTWNGSADLMVTERTGIIGGAVLTLHDQARSFGLHLGIKRLLMERFWKRVYLHVSPELLVVWRDGDSTRYDAAARAGIGYEQLFMWGFGYVVELHGSAPLGRGSAEPLDAASAGATIGLFMEF